MAGHSVPIDFRVDSVKVTNPGMISRNDGMELSHTIKFFAYCFNELLLFISGEENSTSGSFAPGRKI